MSIAIGSFPTFREHVEDLVNQHRKLMDEPVLMAVYYAPDRDPDDIFLFEVLDNFSGNTIADEGDLLEVIYGPTGYFPIITRNSKLHIILASPDEFYAAAEQRTPLFREIKEAVESNRSQIIFLDPAWARLGQVLS
jgi:hypothetical protein